MLLKIIEKLIPYKRIREREVFNVLVIDLNYLGDMLMSSPVYREISKRIKPVNVDCLVYNFCKPVMEHNPYVDKIYTLKNKKFLTALWECIKLRRKYDLVLQLNTSLRTNFLMFFIAPLRLGYNYKHRGCFNNVRVPIEQRTANKGYRVDECLNLLEKAFGWSIKNRNMVFKTIPESVTLPERFRDKKVIGIHIPTRQMEVRGWDKWVELCNYLTKNYYLIFTGTLDDRRKIDKVTDQLSNSYSWDLCLSDSINYTANLLKRFDLFITVNTGIMHLAIALNIPTVAIISGSPAEVVAPIGKSFRFVENKDIKQIDVENVINAIKEILK